MTADRRPPRSRRSGVRTSVLTLSVLIFIALLLWVSDFVSRTGAQSLIARTIQHDIHTPNRPEVHLRGTFFLPQVIEGRYDHVSVQVAPIQAGSLRIADVQADLYGVHLPFHDLLVRNTVPIVIDRSDESATLRYSDLNRYLTATGHPLSIGSAGHHELRVTGSVTILGRRISASADAEVAVGKNALTVTPTQLDSGVPNLDQASRALLGHRLTIVVPLQALPFGQTVTGVTIGSRALTVHAHGRHIVIAHQRNS